MADATFWPEHLYECQWFFCGWVFFPSLRFWQFSFLLTQGFNSFGIHVEFLHQKKLTLWACKAEIFGNFIRVLTLISDVSLKVVFLTFRVTYCQNLSNTQGWVENLAEKITFSRSFKEKQRYRNSKTELFYLSGLLALPWNILVNTMSVLFQCCSCTNSFFLAIYVNDLATKMSTWHKSKEISPNFFDRQENLQAL